MLRHIAQASQVFQLHEQTLIQNRDYFLPNKQLSFLQLINTFVNAIHPTYNNTLSNNELLRFLIIALEYICYLKETMEYSIGKLFSVFMMDDDEELQNVLNSFINDMNNCELEKHLQFKNILNNIDAAVDKVEISLKMLQDKVLPLQEIHGEISKVGFFLASSSVLV